MLENKIQLALVISIWLIQRKIIALINTYMETST